MRRKYGWKDPLSETDAETDPDAEGELNLPEEPEPKAPSVTESERESNWQKNMLLA